jgi:homocysteine S-methyltransferase
MVLDAAHFTVVIEVVPPAGAEAGPLLAALAALKELPVDSFSVATNPVAKPRMSAMALCALIQKHTQRPAILHCTTRDHNRLSLQGLLWGALALGIETVLAATGDFVAFQDLATTSDVRDMDVFGLITLARQSGLRAGVAFDPRPESSGLEREVQRLMRKIDAGAQFAVTQPVYDEASADRLSEALRPAGIPVIMGILPLRSPRHAEFLHHKVAGIEVPEHLRRRMQQADDPVAEGVSNAREMLAIGRRRFAGACVMPPFDRYEMLHPILGEGHPG